MNVLSFQVRYVKTSGKHRNATSVERIAAKEELGRSARKLAKLVDGGLILDFEEIRKTKLIQ